MKKPPLNPELQQLAGALIAEGEAAIPGPVMEAFLPEALKIGPFTLDPATFASLLLLHSADSPFVTDRPVTHNTLILDIATAVHILATPWKTVRAEVKEGVIGERVWETAAQIPTMSPEEMQAAVAAIAGHVNKGFATVLAMKQPGESDEDLAQKKMPDSDGGSSS